MPERFKGVDSSSTIERFVGSNPTPYNSIYFYTIVYGSIEVLKFIF